MSKKQNTKFITPDILKGAVKGAFIKLNPRYMMKNPVMFVVEIGFFITLLLSFVPGLFGDANAEQLRIYDIIVCAILFVTVLFANFAEAVAEGRGKAQAASLKKTQKDTQAHLLHEGPGGLSEKDPEGYPGTPAPRGWHSDHRLLQRAEEGRCGPGQRRRDHSQRRRGH